MADSIREDEIRNALGKALLLELHKPSQKLQYRYSMDSEWFEKHETGELIYRFLDSLALLVATGPGGHNVTACALDTHRPKDESSGPTLTIRVARNGTFHETKLREYIQYIVEFVNGKQGISAEDLTKHVVGHCKDAILECIHGRNHNRVRDIRKTIEFILSPEDRDENMKSVQKRLIESKHPGCGEVEYKDFEVSLRSFKLALEKLPLDDKAFLDNICLYIQVLHKANAFLVDEVAFPILEMFPYNSHKLIRYLDRLRRYSVGIDIMSLLQEHKSMFPYPVNIKFTSSRAKKYLLPELLELRSLVDNKGASYHYPPPVQESYQGLRERFYATEHAEMQLVSYYLQNEEKKQVVNYIGVSKFCCYMCAIFLKYLQGPNGGRRLTFAVLRTHGKVYGQWLPPAVPTASDHIKRKVDYCIRATLEDIDTKWQERMNVSKYTPSDTAEWGPVKASKKAKNKQRLQGDDIYY